MRYVPPAQVTRVFLFSCLSASALKKYAADPFWQRRAASRKKEFSGHDRQSCSSFFSKSNHEHMSLGLKTHPCNFPSNDPRLCAMLRPHLISTPVIGDIDGDGDFEVVVPHSHAAVVRDRDTGNTLRSEYMNSFAMQDLFPADGFSSVNLCRPQSKGKRVRKRNLPHFDSILPAEQQPWLGYLGTCATSDMFRHSHCGAVHGNRPQ